MGELLSEVISLPDHDQVLEELLMRTLLDVGYIQAKCSQHTDLYEGIFTAKHGRYLQEPF